MVRTVAIVIAVKTDHSKTEKIVIRTLERLVFHCSVSSPNCISVPNVVVIYFTVVLINTDFARLVKVLIVYLAEVIAVVEGHNHSTRIIPVWIVHCLQF